MPLIKPKTNMQQGTGRPAKYGPLPATSEEMYPMRLEEMIFRIKYFRGYVVYAHTSPHFDQELGLKLTKPDMQSFIEDMDKEGIVFSCYYNSQELDALIISIVGTKPETVQAEKQFFATPEEYQPPTTRRSTQAAYDENGEPIVVKTGPNRWKMGTEEIEADSRPTRFRRGYNPLRDAVCDEFYEQWQNGQVIWDDEDLVYYARHEGYMGSKYPEIPQDSIFSVLNGKDPMLFKPASQMSGGGGQRITQTYEEQQTTTVEDIQVQRHYLRQHGKDPDKMGPAYALPKGVYDLPDDWVDPETAG